MSDIPTCGFSAPTEGRWETEGQCAAVPVAESCKGFYSFLKSCTTFSLRKVRGGWRGLFGRVLAMNI